MDSEFIERLQSMSLTAEEGEIIKFRSNNQAKILEERSLSLMGRFHMSKPLNTRVAKKLLQLVWKFGQDLRIIEVGDGLFQLIFPWKSY